VLVFVYYLISLTGQAMARQGKIAPAVGIWAANFLFALAGMALLWKVDRASLEVGSVGAFVKEWWEKVRPPKELLEERRADIRVLRGPQQTSRFPLILDNYVLRNFFQYLMLVLMAFTVLTLVFTFFELIGDIIRNRVALVTVGEYLINVLPSLIDTTMPLSTLIAVLVTFSLLQSSNELTAMKATGVSIYRTIAPVLVVALTLSAALFFFEQYYLPDTYTRQEALRNSIKGKPAQTFLRPERKWIFGEKNVIYYYEHFDAEADQFSGLSGFEFDPHSFAIVKRMYATHAHWEDRMNKWVLEDGWVRTMQEGAVKSYQKFDVTTLAEVAEPPAYFKKEVKQSAEMNYSELDAYIQDLRQSGFDVVRLRVQLYKKLAFPLIVFVMALLAVPFALTAGRRGALTGVAVALGLAIVYWVTNGLFEALGNVNYLPAALAAWAPDLLFALAGGYLLFKVPT